VTRVPRRKLVRTSRDVNVTARPQRRKRRIALKTKLRNSEQKTGSQQGSREENGETIEGAADKENTGQGSGT